MDLRDTSEEAASRAELRAWLEDTLSDELQGRRGGAKLFGLYPREGTIALGSDADIVVFDHEKRHLITAATQHSKTDYNLDERTEVTGSPETVLLRGNVLVENGDLVAEPGVGQFVERAAFG